ncbi:MAG: caspase family protein [Nitratireductor sp.]|nr:caspase family protein [Nitratireductor sp.]
MRLLILLLSALLLAVNAGEASAAKRLALVIGNDRYENITRLQKAVNDAQAIGTELSRLGFEVVTATNTTRREMNGVLAEFTSKIAKGDTAMVFYAGHGVQIEGKNYLLPVDIPDAQTGEAGYIEAEALALDDIVARLKARGPLLNLLVIDACRNNPFSNPAARSLGSGRGLSGISAPQGTFVMYSADEGEAALDRLGGDDANPNSVFTRELLPLMRNPELDLVDLARELRRRVRKLALSVGHNQLPAYYDAVLGDFFFAGKDEGNAGEEVASLPPADTRQTREPESPSALAPLEGRSLVATAGEKDSIRLWDPHALRLIGELEGEKIGFSALAIIGHGRAIAVATGDGALYSYAIPEFKKKAALYPGFRVTSIAEAGDGVLVIGGEDGTMATLDAESFDVLWKARIHTGIVSPILVSGDEKTALTASADGTIATIRLSDGNVQARVSTLPGKSITDIDFLSPTLVVAVHEDGTIAQINLKTGRLFAAFSGNRGWISSVQSLGAGEYVTANVDGMLSFYEVGSDRPTRELKAHGDVAAGAKQFSVSGREQLLSVGFDGAVKLWDNTGQHLEGEAKHGGAVLFFDYISGS